MDKNYVKSKIRHLKDWPKPGIIFPDITTLFKDANALNQVINDLKCRYTDKNIDLVVGIDARGFILGGSLAFLLGAGFVPARKKGKLPAEVVETIYDLEYGTDTLAIHKDAISPRQKILLVDDVLATGGSALAAAELIKRLGGDIIEIAFVVNLPAVGGEKRIQKAGYKCYTQIEFIY